jgi:hypothetical protein
LWDECVEGDGGLVGAVIRGWGCRAVQGCCALQITSRRGGLRDGNGGLFVRYIGLKYRYIPISTLLTLLGLTVPPTFSYTSPRPIRPA